MVACRHPATARPFKERTERLRWPRSAPKALRVSNNPYGSADLAGLDRRARLDTGALGVIAITVDNTAQAVELLRGRRASTVQFASTNSNTQETLPGWVRHSRQVNGWGDATEPAQAWIAHVRRVLQDAT
jgi:hypothetical protein